MTTTALKEKNNCTLPSFTLSSRQLALDILHMLHMETTYFVESPRQHTLADLVDVRADLGTSDDQGEKVENAIATWKISWSLLITNLCLATSS